MIGFMVNDQLRLRVDKFVVPEAVHQQFVEKMKYLQQTLRRLPGCKSANVLSKTEGAGEYNVITLVEWENEAAIADAFSVMQQKFAEEKFDPKEFTRALGVKADLGFYKIV
ncbi:hypothetical protein GCM10011613_00540 [Cellvibrio zantedeschiae]|uniref:ABM domain-containing protein n=1 Tax=Cellvibrio zantedeschiae TaxID=1237077 RepID=A0ABQ3AQR2_9GAMM|nr:antibiotic biosynthesis monooxygenase [Cellvibrio zantedeschiae]GGY61079.1 hypothetical protein GCM10011613_00540 [Cellvibrio zantedeschiae]